MKGKSYNRMTMKILISLISLHIPLTSSFYFYSLFLTHSPVYPVILDNKEISENKFPFSRLRNGRNSTKKKNKCKFMDEDYLRNKKRAYCKYLCVFYLSLWPSIFRNITRQSGQR